MFLKEEEEKYGLYSRKEFLKNKNNILKIKHRFLLFKTV